MVEAIKNRTTVTVTGGDMAELLVLLENDTIFGNKNRVEAAMNERNTLCDTLLQKIQNLIDEHKHILPTLPRPDQIQSFNEHINVTLDRTSNRLREENNVFYLSAITGR